MTFPSTAEILMHQFHAIAQLATFLIKDEITNKLFSLTLRMNFTTLATLSSGM